MSIVRSAVARLLDGVARPHLVGFWWSPEEPHYPKVQSMVDWSWDRRARADMVRYLRNGRKSMAYLGCSSCRICDVDNGTCDMTDGEYTWPEGFAHYVEKHGVRPPYEFIEHVIRRKWRAR